MSNLRRQIDEYNRARRTLSEPEMTQRRLAQLAGVHERTVFRHVHGDTSMSLGQAVAYARILGCPVEDLLNGEQAA